METFFRIYCVIIPNLQNIYYFCAAYQPKTKNSQI